MGKSSFPFLHSEMHWWQALKTRLARLSGRRLSEDELQVLRRIAQGWTLKSHRYLDGTKVYQLRPPDGDPQTVAYALVQKLIEKKLITTNQKFPAATFLLTSKGKKIVSAHTAVQGLSNIVHFDS